MDLAVGECPLRVSSSLGLDNTLSVGELVRILSEDVMDSYKMSVRHSSIERVMWIAQLTPRTSTKVTPVKVQRRVRLEVGGRHFV